MTGKPEKYRVVYYPSDAVQIFYDEGTKGRYRTWEQQINALAEAGYKIHTVCDDFVVMVLDEDRKYENIKSLVDVDPRDVDEKLREGYVVVDSWTKNVRMVRR